MTEDLRLGRPDRRRGSRPGTARSRSSGIVKYGDLSSIGGATFAIFDVPTAQTAAGQGGQARRSAGRGGGRHDTRAADGSGSGRRSAGDFTVPHGRRGGERAVERDRDVHDDHPLLPALVRGHRALRRSLRDLQHALDHGRAADAGVRDPADARRVAAAGAEVGDSRSVRDRLRRLRRRAVQRSRARRRAERALQGAEPRPASDRDRLCDPDGRRLAARRDARDAAGGPLPRDSRDARAADRGGARRGVAARVDVLRPQLAQAAWYALAAVVSAVLALISPAWAS